MTGKTISEDQMVHIVRNALIVAGQEMGEGGDHWPVINATIHEMTKDWEDLQVERNVFSEVKKHYEDMIQQLIKARDSSAEEYKADLDATITEIRGLYRACFDEVEDEYYGDTEMPTHMKRAQAIIDTLED